jgi:hypothetical protein
MLQQFTEKTLHYPPHSSKTYWAYAFASPWWSGGISTPAEELARKNYGAPGRREVAVIFDDAQSQHPVKIHLSPNYPHPTDFLYYQEGLVAHQPAQNDMAEPFDQQQMDRIIGNAVAMP